MGYRSGFRLFCVFITHSRVIRHQHLKANYDIDKQYRFYALDLASSVVSEEEARTTFRSPENPSVEC